MDEIVNSVSPRPTGVPSAIFLLVNDPTAGRNHFIERNGLHFEQFEIGLRSLRFRKDDFTGMGIPSGSVIVSRAPGLLGLVIVPFGFMVMAVVIAVFRFGRMSVPGRSGARRPVPATRHQGYGQYAC